MKRRAIKVLALGLLAAAALFCVLTAVVFLTAPVAANEDCATASLRHQANSAWAGYTCADIDDLVAAGDSIKSQARNTGEKWGDLTLAFVAVILAAFSALLAQALIRTAIAMIDSMRPEDDSPFYLSQFRLLYRKKEPTLQDVEKMRALAVVIAGGATTRALFAVVFSVVYLALLTG